MTAFQFQAEIFSVSARYGIDPMTVAGLVSTESGFNQYAWNPEPHYRYLWDVRHNTPFRALTPVEIESEFPPRDFPAIHGDPDQEWWGQQASWGLMQVMGAVAREHGHRGPYLTEMCDPIQNLMIGCVHLRGLIDWAKGDIEQALAAYNGGKVGNVKRPFRNQPYATKVISARALLKT